ncbi:MAG: glycosyltransferase family 39 protein [Candidatus Omnitrophica bacterium]|nr:glycosyltransferase family 39 protein [Candidatus Omnitrophota bacterium]MBU1853433.1 glycosyltransferase family 39 protein [Candidatus Omnitrophota bacterium]
MKIGLFVNLNKRIIIALLILFFFIIRAWFFLNTDNLYGAIPSQKIIHSQLILENPFDVWDVNPLLYPYLLGAWIKVTNDILVSPRILSLVFSVLMVVPFFKFCEILFREKRKAVLATVLLGIFPVHIMQSVVSMEEVFFYFFLFFSLYFFLKYKYEKQNIKILIVSALLLTISCGFRFEGFLYPALLFLFLLGKDKKPCLIFLGISMAVPVLWGLISYVKWHNPFSSFWIQDAVASLEIELYNQKFKNVFESVMTCLPLAAIIFGFLGLLAGLKNKRLSVVYLCFFVFLGIFTFKILNKGLLFQERYVLAFSIFFIIFIAEGVYSMLDRLSKVWIRNSIVVILCMYYFFYTAHLFRENEFFGMKAPEEIRHIIALLRDEQRNDAIILLDVDMFHEYPEYINVSAGFSPKRAVMPLVEEIMHRRLTPGTKKEHTEFDKRILRLLKEKKINYILYCTKDGYLKYLFPLSGDLDQIEGSYYKRIFKGNIFWLYKISQG